MPVSRHCLGRVLFRQAMMKKVKLPDWYHSFQQWARQTNPGCEWIYRGQAAQYTSIIPALARGSTSAFCRSKLFELDYEIAESVLRSSPEFRLENLYPDLILNGSGGVGKPLSFLFGGYPTYHPALTFHEVVRGLAQHYDFPTFFVDLTCNPMVAAFFATHSFRDGHYVVRHDEPGVVYRWPAIRNSRARLEIQDCAVPVVDLSTTNSLIMRPHNQWAVVASVVSDRAFPPMAPGKMLFNENMDIVDLATLANCESFELPPGAGVELAEFEGTTVDALFPDSLDLGYSYISLVALLSIIVHRIDQIAKGIVSDRAIENLSKDFDQGVFIGQVILDRECFRLVPGCQVTDTMKKHTLDDAEGVLSLLADKAIRATHLMRTDSVKANVEAIRHKQAERLVDRAKTWSQALETAYKKVAAGGKECLPHLNVREPNQVVWHDFGIDWVLDEIKCRRKQVEALIDQARQMPVYVLQNPEDHENLLNAFSTGKLYEETILRQSAATRRWMDKQLASGGFGHSCSGAEGRGE